jgi:hypothetical protein
MIRDAINEYTATRNEIIGDAGRYWQECEYTMRVVNEIDGAIVKLKHELATQGEA